LANILSLIDSQKNPYPSLAEFTWRDRLGPEERRVPEPELGSLSLPEVTIQGDVTFTQDEAKFHQNFNKLAGLYMLKAVKEMNLEEVLKKENSSSFTWPRITEKLGVLPVLSKFLRYILLELEKDGWLTKTTIDEPLTFVVENPLPTLEWVKGQLTSVADEIWQGGIGLKELDSTRGVWEVLSGILNGSVAPLPLLFPDSTSVENKGPAEVCYTESLFAQQRYVLNEVETKMLAKLGEMGNKSVVRVLEVGAGVGSETIHLIKGMIAAGK
jgi:hypothetical protein